MSQRTEFVNVKVYGVVGPDNVLHTVTAGDSSDEVRLDVINEDGHYEFFEAEAYHLYSWCRERDFQYYEGLLEDDVELELIND